MITGIIIVGILLVLALVLFGRTDFARNQGGTMMLFVAGYENAIQSGAPRRDAYRKAFADIRHRAPIGELSEDDIANILDVFSLYENPMDPGVLVQHALKTGQAMFLREPYLTRLKNKAP